MTALLGHPRAGVLTPLLRAAVRYAPPSAARTALWERVIDPYFAWRDRDFVADTAAGRVAGNTRDILQQYLYFFGVWEPAVTAFLRRRLAPGDGFLDVGANVGYFTLLASRRVGPTGGVVSVEAAPAVYAALAANVARNRAANVRTLHLAASAAAGRVRLYCGQAGNCGATSVVPEAGQPAVAEVDAAPLADLLTPAEAARLRLVKIDVEGAEAEVVAGLGPLAAGRPDREYLIEVHPAQLAALGHTPDDVLGPFRDAGFHAYAVGNDYDPAGYVRGTPPDRPRRLRGVIEWDTNVVLSRLDREEL